MNWDNVEQMIRKLRLPNHVREHALAWVSTEMEAGTTCPVFRRFNYDEWGWRLSWEDESGARETIRRLILESDYV